MADSLLELSTHFGSTVDITDMRQGKYFLWVITERGAISDSAFFDEFLFLVRRVNDKRSRAAR